MHPSPIPVLSPPVVASPSFPSRLSSSPLRPAPTTLRCRPTPPSPYRSPIGIAASALPHRLHHTRRFRCHRHSSKAAVYLPAVSTSLKTSLLAGVSAKILLPSPNSLASPSRGSFSGRCSTWRQSGAALLLWQWHSRVFVPRRGRSGCGGRGGRCGRDGPAADMEQTARRGRGGDTASAGAGGRWAAPHGGGSGTEGRAR